MNKRLRSAGLKGLVLGSLISLVGCNPTETRLERSEILGKVPVRIETKYTAPYTTYEPSFDFDEDGNITFDVDRVNHPEEFRTTIMSDSLTQEMSTKLLFDYFSKNKPDSLEYADFSENTYETDLETHQIRKVYSRTLGRQFVLPFTEIGS